MAWRSGVEAEPDELEPPIGVLGVAVTERPRFGSEWRLYWLLPASLILGGISVRRGDWAVACGSFVFAALWSAAAI